MIYPVKYDKGGYRGYSWNYKDRYKKIWYHCGHDFHTLTGAPFYAVTTGVVTSVELFKGGFGGQGIAGGVIIIEHTAVDSTGNEVVFWAMYGHVGTYLRVGDVVDEGQMIGVIHSYWIDDDNIDHLHFCINTEHAVPVTKWGYVRDLKGEGWTNPRTWLDGFGAKRPA